MEINLKALQISYYLRFLDCCSELRLYRSSLIKLPDGTMWPPAALLVGFVFVARDFAKREVGHKVFLAMLVGVAISCFMANPFVATASAAASLLSELVDWAVYT